MSWNSPWEALLGRAPKHLPNQTILLHGSNAIDYAYQLAARILNDAAIQEKKWNPDFYENFPSSKGGLHLIDTPRIIQKTLWLEPFGNDYKVYLIHDIDRITLPAISAFLKILEEPPQHSVFILTAKTSHYLPATILSRCLSLYLGHVQHTDDTKQIEVHHILDILHNRISITQLEQSIFNIPGSEKTKEKTQEMAKSCLDVLVKILRDRFVLEHISDSEEMFLYFSDYLQEIRSLPFYPLHQVIFIVEKALQALDNMTSAITCLSWIVLQLQSLKYKSQKTTT